MNIEQESPCCKAPSEPDYSTTGKCIMVCTKCKQIVWVEPEEEKKDKNAMKAIFDRHKEGEIAEEKKDISREMCIKQGYVPPKCTLPGLLAMFLVQKGEDPCAGCNMDRGTCEGRPKKGVGSAQF